jgi:membrane-bound lytic murein transglycosylase MltF
MKITEKTQRRFRNFIISLTIICLTPLCEKGRMLNGAHSVNAYAGREIVCAIDLGNDMYGSHGLETGFNYELMRRFAQDNHCDIKIIAARKNDSYLDSLKQGKVDIVITHNKDICTDGDITILNKMNNCSVWAFNSQETEEIRQIDTWIGYIKASEEFDAMADTFDGPFNPQKRADRGVKSKTVSPYDHLFKKYAKLLGWDWRMVAAVVYQESKFSISSLSHRGAIGLMQVMPQTGRCYGVDNLLDPEQNIMAGTNHLKRLQKLFSKYDLTHEELIKFTLAAYNAGEGRITDCRNLAAAKGFDNSRWDEIVKVIPIMREDSILEEESVKLGKFQGYETIAYIESVLAHYNAICEITSL